MKRTLVVALLAAAVAAVTAAQGAPTPMSPLLGVVGEKAPLHLARIDPDTLQPLPGTRVEAGSGGCASRDGGEACWTVPPWALSPDRKLLALASNDRFQVRSLRVVDVSSLRVRTVVPLRGDPVGSLVWFSGGRLFVVQEVCCSGQQLLAVDVAKRRVSARAALNGSVLQLARTGHELVLVLAPTGSIGRATLAVADRRGRVRTVRLGEIAAGVSVRSGPRHGVDSRVPGLAVDPLGRHAYVVGDRLIADVDLARLSVAYHGLGPRGSSRALAMATKGGTGTSRSARWLGNGFLAVTGVGEETVDDRTHVQPLGLRLVDTRSWSSRIVDPDATSFDVTGDLLLATGWSTDTGRHGLAAYSFDGSQRFRLFDGQHVSVAQTYAGRSYVIVIRRDGIQDPLRVVDLAAGKVVGTRSRPLPWLLLGQAGGWWG